MPATTGSDPRRRARETALKVLYEWELSGQDLDAVLDSWRHERPYRLNDEQEVVWPTLDDETWALAEGLARGAAARLAEIDPLIAAQAEHWRLERMPVVDRLILRLAVFELLASPETPRAVVINEALELARTFSTESAVKFVNGVLDAVRRAVSAPPEPR
jgi:N utilization substance protein B